MIQLQYYSSASSAEVNVLENVWRASVNASISAHVYKSAIIIATQKSSLPVEVWMHILSFVNPKVHMVAHLQRVSTDPCMYRASLLNDVHKNFYVTTK